MLFFGYCYLCTEGKDGVKLNRPSFNTLCTIPSNDLALPCFILLAALHLERRIKEMLKKEKFNK
jgi:hypothetical protein